MLHIVELYFQVVLDGGRIEGVASVRLQIPATTRLRTKVVTGGRGKGSRR